MRNYFFAVLLLIIASPFCQGFGFSNKLFRYATGRASSMSKFVTGFDALVKKEASDKVNFRLGENGLPEYTIEGVGDPRVGLFFSLTQGANEQKIHELTNLCLNYAYQNTSDYLRIHDLFVLAFNTRDCRGGKGEKELSYNLIGELYKHYPNTTLALLSIFPEYGYFKDYFRLLEMSIPNEIDSASNTTEKHYGKKCYGKCAQFEKVWHRMYKRTPKVPVDDQMKLSSFTDTIVGYVAAQLIKDNSTYNTLMNDVYKWNSSSVYTPNRSSPINERLSNCAKWVPREGTCYSRNKLYPYFEQLVYCLYPEEHNRKRHAKYQRLVANITRFLDTPEVKMSSGRWDEINFKRVPSKCLTLNRKAFLNERLTESVSAECKDTGNREPNNTHRVVCRQKLINATLAGKIHGKMLFPSDIVGEMMDKESSLSSMELLIMNAQWNDIRNYTLYQIKEAQEKHMTQYMMKLQQQLNETNTDNADSEKTKPNKVLKVVQADNTTTTAGPVDLGKLVPLVDVSGSMCGEPRKNAIALGLLITEITHPAFRNRVLTFTSDAEWCDLSSCKDNELERKVEILRKAPWGGNTNIEAAFNRIIDVVIAQNLSIDEVPDLIIFSDMQFDEAGGGETDTQLKNIENHFAQAGIKLCGKPYPMPRIIFWNLRGDTYGYPAEKDSKNVQMLSGFSPSLFKHLITGEQEKEVEQTVVVENDDGSTTTTTIQTKQEITPYDTLRKVLDDTRYDAVRLILSQSQEGLLANYTFTPSDDSPCYNITRVPPPVPVQDIPPYGYREGDPTFQYVPVEKLNKDRKYEALALFERKKQEVNETINKVMAEVNKKIHDIERFKAFWDRKFASGTWNATSTNSDDNNSTTTALNNNDDDNDNRNNRDRNRNHRRSKRGFG